MSQDGPVLIRPETTADTAPVRRVVARAFGSDVEADLVNRIRASPGYVPEMALVATVAGAIVGHVMISVAILRHDAGDRPIVMLSPLAVDPDHQRRGVGSALVRAAVAVADRRGEPLVVLEGNPAWYGRLGFEPAARHGIVIHLPDWAPPEAAQVLRLAAYAPDDPTLRGTVVYPPAFDQLP
jgi:putative acetyltransferase